MDDARKKYLSSVRSMVVKLGTQLLSDKDRRLDGEFLSRVARQVAELRQRGVQVTIVSSGAIGAGLAELNLPGRPTDLARLQAVAAVGQRRLMDGWAAAFAPMDLHVAQVLLTREDIDQRSRFLNVRNTLGAIHELGAVPIVNENDTISTDELVKISFGDNDILAALVTHALRAQLLVLMTVVDGLLDENAQPVRLVEDLEKARALVRAETSDGGKGGMNSKLEAARMIGEAGETMVVVDGRMDDVLIRILDQAQVGTLFVPRAHKRSSRSRWIGSVRLAGSIIVDDGAARALTEKNRSLLPAGIVAVEGQFAPGDCVAVRKSDGAVVARGLTNYAAEQVTQIRGKKTQEVRRLLGEAAYEEVIHRDNLVIG